MVEKEPKEDKSKSQIVLVLMPYFGHSLRYSE